MTFEIFDEVTADCLEVGDIIYINTHQDQYWAHMQITKTEDFGDSIVISGIDVSMDENYELPLDPDQKMSLYMEIDPV